jgi:glycerate 2-kinase
VSDGRRVLVAPDSFKGTFGAEEVAAAIGRGVEGAGGEADPCPLADGGEGTAAILLNALGGEWVEREVTDPLGRPVTARFALLADGGTAALDMASASGLPLVALKDSDAEAASTRGTGELIAAAIDAGATTVLVGAGGSATTDGGAGAIAALEEWSETDTDGGGRETAATDWSEAGAPGEGGGLRGGRIEVLCDVQEPFERAASVFGPQKGADPATVARLERRLDQLAAELPRDPRGVPMTGCAGGLSGGLWARFDAMLAPGAERILDLLDFDARLARADLVLTGEGRLDRQSFTGKVVGTVAERARAAGRPCHAIVGGTDLSDEEASAAGLASVTRAGTLEAIAAAAFGLH